MKKIIMVVTVSLIFGLTAPLAAAALDNGLSNADFFYGISSNMDKSLTIRPAGKKATVKEDRKTDIFKDMTPGYFFGYINVDAGNRFSVKSDEQDEVKFNAEKSLSPDYFFGYRNP
ncbi:MAG: hypothetical protein GXP53_06610 [Deltaproteobacteria bacterium]|nr:hypothetical protein [Deltaproteobacteria bacterium]